MIGTNDDYSSDMSTAPDYGNSNDDGTLTTYSVVVNGPSFDDDETFNNPFDLPRSPDLASLSSSPKQAVVFTRLPVCCSTVTGKNTMFLKHVT